MLVKSVELKEGCLMLNGEPVVLLSSSLFYFRIPREYWGERMRQLKAGGYRAIDVYIPWNFHELSPDEWDFSGMRDIDYFLELASENGLYVVARPGPYICSEWDGGALPAWLDKEKMQLRQYDADYLAEVEKWFAKIFPILKKRQLGSEGSVILIQLENELDIFQCKEPRLYLEELVAMAKPYNFEIPLVVCTSSQLDVDLCGASARDVYPAFNIYSTPDHPAIEEKMEIIWSHLQRKGTPLLTTETMREHYFLRRELIGGVRLISPYCQTASANYDCYTGISTWGNNREKPISYMTNDYDHGAMIREDGKVTEDYLEARLMGNLIYTLGEKLAAGHPNYEASVAVRTTFAKEADKCIAMELKDGGQLLCIPNIGNTGGTAYFEVEGKNIEAYVDAMTTLLLPIHVPLDSWGALTEEIVYSSMEILSIGENEKGQLEVVLYGKGSGALIRTGDTDVLVKEGEEKLIETGSGMLLCVKAISRQEASLRKTPFLPAFEERMAGETHQDEILEADSEPFYFPEAYEKRAVDCMENYGMYFGIVRYQLDLPDNSCGLLLEGAADMVRVSLNGKCFPAFYGTGNMLEIMGKGKKADVQVESWGHNCGHGIGYSVITLGCRKGIREAYAVLSRKDIQYNWSYHVMPNHRSDSLRLVEREWRAVSDFGDRLPMDIDEMPIYQKNLQMPTEGTHRFLYNEGGELPMRIYLNGSYAGSITKEKGWLDITSFTNAGKMVNVAVTYAGTGLNPVCGHLYLVAAEKIEDCMVSLFPVSEWKALKPAGDRRERLPLILNCGERRKMTFAVTPDESEGERWLSFEGRGVKVTVICNQYVMGRIFVNCNMPLISVCSGDPDRVWLPPAFLQENPYVTIVVEAMEADSVLEKIVVETR